MQNIAQKKVRRAGSRGSPLALVQTKMAIAALAEKHSLAPDCFTITTVHTLGDQARDRPLAEIGGKAVWTKELDRALLDDEIDFAVHSLKDVETILADGIMLAAVLERADPRDRLIGADSLAALPEKAVVGTSSPRRAALLRSRRPDLEVVNLRGNVGTRLKRIAEGKVAATLLAAAGLDRLGVAVGTPLPPEDWLPAVGQGVIALTCRKEDADTRALLAAIDHQPTHLAVDAERSFLKTVGGSCHSAIGIHARLDGEEIGITAELLSLDGRESVRDETRGPVAERVALAQSLAKRLLARATPAIRASLA